MAQVTIYVEDSALEAARQAAARAHMSLSQWFAQFAAAEQRRRSPPAQRWSPFCISNSYSSTVISLA